MRGKSLVKKPDLRFVRYEEKKLRERTETEAIQREYFFARRINPSNTFANCDKTIGNYRRSLKLLGVQVPELESKIRANNRCASAQSWKSWHGTPAKLQTRLTKKSTSLEDVTNVIPQLKEPEKLPRTSLGAYQRKILSQAVYEEWYFRKEKEIKDKKLLMKEEEEQSRCYKEKLEEKKKGEAEERFKEWLRNKEEKRREGRNRRKGEKDTKEKEETKKEKANKGFNSWMEKKLEKDREMRRKRREEKEEKEAKKELEEKEKKEEADMVFKTWLKGKNKQFLERRRREERERVLKKKMEEYEKEERRREALLVYNHWKATKERDDRERENNNILTVSRGEHRRLKSRLKTYSEWLDEVEDRESSTRYYQHKQNVELALRPPWIPGGGSMPSLLTENSR